MSTSGIPQTHEQRRHCVIVACGIEPTPAFARERPAVRSAPDRDEVRGGLPE